ncbi:protein ZINC INDUCED FACILITATOR-LIKE 1-like [Humulus lupulus]|uniref:protein ZINC INDUCED FACILITATOR-LIKE 1-like n=1 Tax=Humulus lupulus TaxID=3486 RepID=UPI002B40FA25|nr:protein ZINC INDUCED FACILITATOR-LIKE 1-like [Humulus lupulus]
MDDENREVLLVRHEEEEEEEERVYYDDESCPGCVLDKIKQSNSAVPFNYLFFVFLLALAAALPISSLFPFLYFMIRDFGIAKKDEDIGYYAGAVGCAFMFGRFLTSIFWGMIADRYGRKPVMIFGTISVVIFNTLFGLSTNFWMALSTRFLLGSLCGILGPMRAYASEICRKEYQALGMSIISTAWGIGLVIGPALGGFLAQPAEKFPKIFSKDSLFGRFPYFLPCLLISTFALGVTFLCHWLPETLHFHNKKDEENESSNGSYPKENLEENVVKCSPQKQSLYKNWPLMSSIMLYCVFQLHDMAYSEIFPLWAVSPKKSGGLSYSSEQVGEVLAISGFFMLLFQLFLYPPIEKTFGPVHLARIGAVITIVVLSTYPFIAKLSGFTLTLLIDLAAVLKNVISVCITTGLFLLQNRSVSQSQRGAANGISMAAMSLFKAIGPAGGGVIFSWAQNHQNGSFLPGDHMVFFILNVIEFIALIMTFKPFLVLADVI